MVAGVAANIFFYLAKVEFVGILARMKENSWKVCLTSVEQWRWKGLQAYKWRSKALVSKHPNKIHIKYFILSFLVSCFRV